MQFDDTGARARLRPLLAGGLRAVLIVVLTLPLPSVAATTDGDDGAATRRFDIPAQPLPQALQLYGEITGVAVLIDAHLLGGLRSTPVNGDLAPMAALQVLLQGTGLVPRVVDGAGLTLLPSARSAAPASAQTPAATAAGNVPPQAARLIQRRLEQALCGSRATRPGSYRAALQLWLDDDAAVVRAALLEGSGDPDRDSAILARVRALALPGVPRGLPQPLTLLLLPRSASTTPPCRSPS